MRTSAMALGLWMLVAAACGGPRGEVTDLTASHTASEQSQATAVGGAEVAVSMSDFAYSPSSFTVKVGTTVRFVFTNEGLVEHEAVVGDEEAQGAAEEAGGSGQVSDTRVEVLPGETRALPYTFALPGVLVLGCHFPGHWDAGMRATITVTGEAR